MKSIDVTKTAANKLRQGQTDLYERDCEQVPKSFIPGEWIQVRDQRNNVNYLGFINLNAENFRPIIYILHKIDLGYSYKESDAENEIAEKWLVHYLQKAVDRRQLWPYYQELCRLVYGDSDNLPGLIVDKYENCLFIDIHTAGLDRFRQVILTFFQQLYPTTPCYLLDKKELRALERLPQFESELSFALDELKIRENGLQLSVPGKHLQKIGYYYDHRDNRQRMKKLLGDWAGEKQSGLDLFCYVGSWGLCQLQAGVQHVTFVDQGSFQETVEKNLQLNSFSGRGEFIRADVFQYLETLLTQKKKFQVIASDPPAFAKNQQSKAGGLSGYLKLHSKLMRLIDDGGIILINSCTQYVSFNELDQTVQEAAVRENKKVRLIDMGLQGRDHPMRGLQSQSHYLKYLAYIVES